MRIGKKRHTWSYFAKEEGYDECIHCELRRRKVTRHCPGVNPARHSYRVWEYRWPNGSWFWLRQRQEVPECRR